MGDQRDAGILDSAVPFSSQMPTATAAMGTGRVLGSRPDEKAGHQPMFSCKRPRLRPWFWTPGILGVLKVTPFYVSSVLQLVNLDIISEYLAKCWEDLTFSRSLCDEVACGTLCLTAEGLRHHERKQSILITVTIIGTEYNSLPKMACPKIRVNSCSHSIQVILSIGKCPSAPPLFNVFTFLSLKII